MAEAEQGAVTGEFPLTPVQREFFANRPADPSHFNQSVLLAVAGPVDKRSLRIAVKALLEQHDALRSRFTHRDGRWTGRVAPPRPAAGTGGCGRPTVTTWPTRTPRMPAWTWKKDRCCDWCCSSDRGQDQSLLMVAHHLVVDAVSWPILVEDLSAAYAQAERGLQMKLPAKTTSFARWARRLAELAASAEVAGEASYWKRVAGVRGKLPRDRDGANTAPRPGRSARR